MAHRKTRTAKQAKRAKGLTSPYSSGEHDDLTRESATLLLEAADINFELLDLVAEDALGRIEESGRPGDISTR